MRIKMNSLIVGWGVISMILAVAFSMAFAGSEPNIKYGLWEVTVKIEMAGMPMQMPAITNTQCITKENAVPDSSQPNQDCKMVDQKFTGDTATWRMECNTEQGKAEAVGEIVYSGDTFNGTLEMSVQGMAMTQKLSGTRLGDCKQ